MCRGGKAQLALFCARKPIILFAFAGPGGTSPSSSTNSCPFFSFHFHFPPSTRRCFLLLSLERDLSIHHHRRCLTRSPIHRNLATMSYRSFAICSLAFFIALSSVIAVPMDVTKTTYVRRQSAANPLTSPVTVDTSSIVETSAGPVTETCEIIMTPINGPNGEPLVQMTRTCSISTSSSGSSSSGSTTTSSDSSSATSAASASTVDSASTSAVSSSTSTSSSAQTAATTSVSADTTSSATVASTTAVAQSPAISSIALSSLPTASVSAASSSAAAATATSAATAAASSAAASSAVVSSAVDSSAAASATQAASSASASKAASVTTAVAASAAADSATATATAQAAFQIPGKQLQVLPIGLGVFAGISVIALIVVGLVTYERTKYRRAFRQRKLAEAGTPYGYGTSA
ncbi:hypothetical protein OF83DRAFT_44573 [Amylostereum chailletii]|nr:hypothetical protein OF83DRAFT_44573 [Amylostereum chailletii]